MSNSLEAKIVVLGSQGVGKTSLVHRYVKNAFTPPTTQSTVGASFLTKRVVDIDTSTVVRLQIWDTAGQERFRSISKLYYRGTLVLLLQPYNSFSLLQLPSGYPVVAQLPHI
jgi:small GTP-binding protein